MGFIFILISSAMFYFIGTELIPDLTHNKILRVLFWLLHLILFLLLISAPFVSRLRKNIDKTKMSSIIQWMAYNLMGFYFVLMSFLLVKALIGTFTDDWYLSGVALVLTMIHMLYGYYIARGLPAILRTEIKLNQLPENLDQFKIVQLSDVHIDQTTDPNYADLLVEKANSLNPDIIVLTGDIVDGFVKDLESKVTSLKKLKANHGVYYIPGNHEYYWNFNEWMHFFKSLNFEMLINENKILNIGDSKLLIAGTHDLAAHRMNRLQKCDPDLALKTEQNVDYKILLTHQPNAIKLIKKEKADLVLAGHTHAGQFFPANLLIYFFQKYVKGLYLVKDTYLYVNQGTGYWGPANRLGTSMEISEIVLVRNR